MPHPKNRFNQTAIVPNTGRVLELSEMVRGMGRTREGLGVPIHAQADFLRKQVAEFEKLKTIFDTYEETGSLSETGRRCNISRRMVAEYVNGRALPRNISALRLKHYLEKRKPIKITQQTLPNLAYVFGAMTAGDAAQVRSLDTMKISKVYLQVKDFAFAKEFSKNLAAIGLKNKVAKEGKFYRLNLVSVSLLSLFNKLTRYGKTVPSVSNAAEFVKSEFPALSKIGSDLLSHPQGRLMFVRGLYDGIGGIVTSSKSRTVNVKINPRNEEMAQLILSVLKENGLNPVRNKDGRIIVPTRETKLFLQRIGLKKDNYPSRVF